MENKRILELYHQQCPSLRVADGNCCVDCKHYEGDPEVDSCNLHLLCHDWDEPETTNFIRFVCDDFKDGQAT